MSLCPSQPLAVTPLEPAPRLRSALVTLHQSCAGAARPRPGCLPAPGPATQWLYTLVPAPWPGTRACRSLALLYDARANSLLCQILVRFFETTKEIIKIFPGRRPRACAAGASRACAAGASELRPWTHAPPAQTGGTPLTVKRLEVVYKGWPAVFPSATSQRPKWDVTERTWDVVPPAGRKKSCQTPRLHRACGMFQLVAGTSACPPGGNTVAGTEGL